MSTETQKLIKEGMKRRRGVEVGEERDYIPIATLSHRQNDLH